MFVCLLFALLYTRRVGVSFLDCTRQVYNLGKGGVPVHHDPAVDGIWDMDKPRKMTMGTVPIVISGPRTVPIVVSGPRTHGGGRFEVPEKPPRRFKIAGAM